MSGKRILFGVTGVSLVTLLAFELCFALRLFTREEALSDVFGDGARIVTETRELSEAAVSNITERLRTPKVKKVVLEPRYDFFFAVRDGKKAGVALIVTEKGKWGPVEVIVAMDPAGAVTRVSVTEHKEKKGKAITERGFLDQFGKKTSKDPLLVKKDIDAISGATISSASVASAVRKAAVLYDALYLGK